MNDESLAEMHVATTGMRRSAALVLLVVVFPVAGVATERSPVAQPAQPPPIAGPPPVAPSPNSCLPGTGSRNWCGDGRPATEAKLAGPRDVTAAPDGTLFIADTLNRVIRRVAPDGVIATVAGDAVPDAPEPIEPAAKASFDQPQGIAYEVSSNSLLVADTGHDAIRRVAADGVVTTVVGGPSRVLTRLRRPGDVASLPDGGMLVVDTGRHRILQISSSGRARRVAGTGRPGFTRRNRRGSSSPLRSPAQVAILERSGMLIADSRNRAIRWLRNGRLRTLAVLARPSVPLGVAASGGRVLATDRGSVRQITPRPSGRVAGTGIPGFTGDRGPALETALNSPRQLALAPDGTLLVADERNDRIRRLIVGDIATIAGSDKPATTSAALRVAAGAQASRCGQYDGYNPLYSKLRLLPGGKRPLRVKGRRKIRLRFKTSRIADIEVRVSRRGESYEARMDNVPKHGAHRITVKGRFGPRKYKAELWGRSLPSQVERCTRRRLRVE